MKESDADHRILAVLRTLDILELFEYQARPLTAQEIARKIGVPYSTTFRLLYTLQDRGYLECERRTATYLPSPRIYNIGRVAVLPNRLRQVAVPFMESLFRTFNEQVLIAVLSVDHIVYVDIIKPANVPRLGANIGSVAPAHATSLGKAILANLPEERVKQIIARVGLPQLTRRTITTIEALRNELEATRKRGYAVNDREQEEDLYGIAAPIFGDQGQVVASICVSGRPVSMIEKDPDIIARALIRAAHDISERLDYPADASPSRFPAAEEAEPVAGPVLGR
jgi:IclR family transcriptional regulator, KDG regulon repressor